MAQLSDKVAFIAAAGGAIAGATARRFAAEGAAVYCIDIDDDTVSQTAAAITEDDLRAEMERLFPVALEQVKTGFKDE